MPTTNWADLWQAAQSDPYTRVVTTLLLLNGLHVDQIAQLERAVIDTDGGWITLPNGVTYPLVSYAREALVALAQAAPELDEERLRSALAGMNALEGEAHRRLAGAIWLTDEEHRLMLEMAATSDAPPLPLRFTFPFSIAERVQPGETSAVAQRGQQVLQTAADWLVEQTLTVHLSPVQRLLGLLRQGSLVFLAASTGVSGLNLIHNVLMGRLLSPADYSQLTFMITLQLLIGLLPTALQTVTARFTARYHAQGQQGALHHLYRRGGRFGWLMGGGLALLLLLAAPLLTQVFRLNDVWLLLPVVLAVPFFVRMGSDRGLLQGLGRYLWLSGAYVTEGVIRLGIGVLLGYALLATGRSLEGAVWGLAQSMAATCFIGWLAVRQRPAPPAADADRADQRAWVQLGWMTALALVGQALITNSDFLLVKNFFTPQEAGLYAAVSVLGRIVYFGALPLTVLLVPLIARRQALNEPTRPVLLLLVGGGSAVCGLLIVAAALFAPQVLGLLYGDAYLAAASLLAPYALAASLYTLTNLVITYQIALGSGGETWMPLAAGGVQIAALLLFHESLAQVVTVQIVLMGVLLVAVLWRVLRVGGCPR